MRSISWILAIAAVNLAECAASTSDSSSSKSVQSVDSSGSPLSGLNLGSLTPAINNALKAGSDATGVPTPADITSLVQGLPARIQAVITSPYVRSLITTFIQKPTIEGFLVIVDEISKIFQTPAGFPTPGVASLPKVAGVPALEKLIPVPALASISGMSSLPRMPSLSDVPSVPQLGGLKLGGI